MIVCGDCLQTHVMCKSIEHFVGHSSYSFSVGGQSQVRIMYRPQIAHHHIMQSVFRKLSGRTLAGNGWCVHIYKTIDRPTHRTQRRRWIWRLKSRMSCHVSFDSNIANNLFKTNKIPGQSCRAFDLSSFSFARSFLSQLTIKLTTFFSPDINCLRQVEGNVRKTTENFKLASAAYTHIRRFLFA